MPKAHFAALYGRGGGRVGCGAWNGRPSTPARVGGFWFTVDVTVDRTRVQVTLLLRPGTAVTVAETKTTTEPPANHVTKS
jgi:hypothetical protein